MTCRADLKLEIAELKKIYVEISSVISGSNINIGFWYNSHSYQVQVVEENRAEVVQVLSKWFSQYLGTISEVIALWRQPGIRKSRMQDVVSRGDRTVEILIDSLERENLLNKHRSIALKSPV